MNNLKEPDFFIAGVPKAGTTYLQRKLAEHKQIAIPRIEGSYFNDKKDYRNYREYLEFLNDEVNSKTEVVGEKSPLYFYNQLALKKIKAKCPEAKLIVIYRQPQQRITSHLKYHYKYGGIDRGTKFHECPEGVQKSLVDRSLYRPYRKKMFDLFTEDSILQLVFQNDIVEDPEHCFWKVTQFLGVDRFVPNNIGRKINSLGPSIEWTDKDSEAFIDTLQKVLRE